MIKLTDATTRPIEIEGDNAGCPGSVFFAFPDRGLCYEIDRADFISALKSEFGLVDPLEIAFAL